MVVRTESQGFGDGLPNREACEGPIALAGAPYINEWNGRRTVELELKDFRPL